MLAGEVHALVGENGAGKSTLMAVAAGSTVPDSGTVEIGGQALESASPSIAQALGLGIVYQHLSILEDLTVIENMVFAMPAPLRPRMSRALAWTREQLAGVGADVDPAERVSDLSTANRQLVEIAKALALDARVLVLDEPTESLTQRRASGCSRTSARFATRAPRSSTSPIAFPRSSRSPTGSPCCATARRAAPSMRTASPRARSCG